MPDIAPAVGFSLPAFREARREPEKQITNITRPLTRLLEELINLQYGNERRLLQCNDGTAIFKQT